MPTKIGDWCRTSTGRLQPTSGLETRISIRGGTERLPNRVRKDHQAPARTRARRTAAQYCVTALRIAPLVFRDGAAERFDCGMTRGSQLRAPRGDRSAVAVSRG